MSASRRSARFAQVRRSPAPSPGGRRGARRFGLWLHAAAVWTLARATGAVAKAFDLPPDAVEKALQRSPRGIAPARPATLKRTHE